MPGNLPLGYDLPKSGTRILEVNEGEAATVRHIFARYLALGSVHALERELASDGIRSKSWTSARGKPVGGAALSRGALFHLLRNPVYLGKIRHKDQVHDGGHDAIIDAELFDRVQRHLDANARRHRSTARSKSIRAPLTGKLFDASGEPMSPTASRGKSGRAYRYYVSASLQKGGRITDDRIHRLAARDIERVVTETLARWLPREVATIDRLVAVRLRPDGLLFELAGIRPASIAAHLSGDEAILHETRDTASIYLPLALPLRGSKRLVAIGANRSARPDPVLIAALRKAHAMLDWKRGMPAIDSAPRSPHDRMILRLALLAPDIQRDIMRGRQPRGFNLEALKKVDVPISWEKQRQALGWDR